MGHVDSLALSADIDPMTVRLNRIYTRSGDDGSTGLGDGSRLPKHHLRVSAYGTLDETSSVLGLALAMAPGHEFASLLLELQNDLFDVGSDLCVPGTAGPGRVPADYTQRLEGHIDRLNADLQKLESFVLPGGTPMSAWLHMGRTVCRRAERLVNELLELPDEAERVNPEVLRYLNRLSDLLFVMARSANEGGKEDVLWQPGKNAK